MNTIAVIPARLGSTRLPGKVLVEIAGRPMLWHVWQRACQAHLVDRVLVATDSLEVLQAVQSWGGEARMTSSHCQSGTERIASLLPELDGDLIVNVQGDEPLLDKAMLDALIECWQAAPCDLITPVYPIHEPAELINSNVVKVVRACDGRALYFSRSPIPHQRGVSQEKWLQQATYWGHVGVYGYRRATLAAYPSLPPSPLESLEKLEQLRFLEAGYTIQTVETAYRPLAVDTPEDLQRVRAFFQHQQGGSHE